MFEIYVLTRHYPLTEKIKPEQLLVCFKLFGTLHKAMAAAEKEFFNESLNWLRVDDTQWRANLTGLGNFLTIIRCVVE